MSGGFTWKEIPGGLYQVIADEETGRVLAHLRQAPKEWATAYLDGKSLGNFVDAQRAREAVELAWADRDRGKAAN